ncbi:MAG: pyridoxal phosphate-dependent aminotransferase [Deltaproteobacteria bacterium]|nr:pyridoxal phosphate-dependent aminotransferase [Deltaproteobacteria bacterium]
MPTPRAQSARTAAVQPSLIRALHDRRRPGSLNLGLGQPSLPVPDPIIDEGLRRLRAGSMGYTANAGLPELRELIAAHHALPGRSGADSAIVTCGAQEAICALFAGLLDPGDEIIVPDPGFPSYEAVARLLGARPVRVARDAADGFRLDAEAVAAAITPRTRAVVVNSPANPTGMVDEEAQLRRLAALAEERDLDIVSDEIYADLHYRPGRVPSAARHTDRAYLVSGLSKNCAMTGFRLGYVIGPPQRMTGVLRAHHMAATCAPVLSQHMAQFVFENPRWLTAQLPIYVERRERALAALRQHVAAPVLEPDGAFYIFADLSAHSDDSLQFALDLLEKTDVITAPGRAFGEAARGWLRLTFADEPAVFAEAAARIGAYLREGR